MRITVQTNHSTDKIPSPSTRRPSGPDPVGRDEAMRLVGLQHDECVRMIASFFGSIASNGDFDTAKAQLGRLGDYIEEHFQSEEDILLRFRDEQYDSHKREHDYFRGRFRNLKHSFLYDFANSARATVDLYHLLTDWLRDHMQVTDGRLRAAHAN